MSTNGDNNQGASGGGAAGASGAPGNSNGGNGNGGRNGNGGNSLARRQRRGRQRSDLISGRAVTHSYQPILVHHWGVRPRDLPLFTFLSIQAMLYDPTIRLGLAMRAAPIYGCQFGYDEGGQWVPGVKCKDQAVGEFIYQQLQRIWNQDINVIVKSQIWGHAGGEVMLKLNDDGLVCVDHLLERHPNDLRALKRGGVNVGIRISRLTGSNQGSVDLEFPKAYWTTLNAEAGCFYGTSILIGAYSPWFDKWCDGGALDVRRLYMHKDAYCGATIWYPEGEVYEMPDGGTVPARDIAQQFVQQILAGGVVALPSETDEKGNKKWEFKPATVASNPAHILTFPQDLDTEMLRGIEVPDDIFTADKQSSGAWAGKKVPLSAFYGGLDTWVVQILKDLRKIFDPLILLNWGKAVDYEITHKPLAQQAMEQQASSGGQQQQGQQQSGQGPPGAGGPGGGGGDEQPSGQGGGGMDLASLLSSPAAQQVRQQGGGGGGPQAMSLEAAIGRGVLAASSVVQAGRGVMDAALQKQEGGKDHFLATFLKGSKDSGSHCQKCGTSKCDHKTAAKIITPAWLAKAKQQCLDLTPTGPVEQLKTCPPIEGVRLGEVMGRVVYSVAFDQANQQFIADASQRDLNEGGNHYRWKFVPFGQFWIDKPFAGTFEGQHFMLHEVIETTLMERLGWDYDRAHEIANCGEWDWVDERKTETGAVSRMAADTNPWQAYSGPRGGKGWKRSDTGDVRYQAERPGAHETGGSDRDEPTSQGEPKAESPAFRSRITETPEFQKAMNVSLSSVLPGTRERIAYVGTLEDLRESSPEMARILPTECDFHAQVFKGRDGKAYIAIPGAVLRNVNERMTEKGPEWSKGENLEDLLRHELAHVEESVLADKELPQDDSEYSNATPTSALQLWKTLLLNISKERIKRDVGEYATRDASECFAELRMMQHKGLEIPNWAEYAFEKMGISEPGSESQVRRMAADTANNPWVRYQGKHGGKGWKHSATGDIRYQEQQPGANETGGEKEGEQSGKGGDGGGQPRTPQELNAALNTVAANPTEYGLDESEAEKLKAAKTPAEKVAVLDKAEAGKGADEQPDKQEPVDSPDATATPVPASVDREAKFEELLKSKTPQDADAFRRAKADGIAIPPAWTEVSYYGKDKDVLAEGRDTKGRKQRAENPEYRKRVSDENNARISRDLWPRIGKLREQLRTDAESGDEEAKVLYLISQTGFRIGGAGDGKAKVKAYGASTLTGDHVKVEGDSVTFDFTGKKGVPQRHTVADPVIAKIVREANPKPGEPLFKTRDIKVREAWQKRYGGYKVHDIRHIVARESAEQELKMLIPPPPHTKKDQTRIIKEVAMIAAHKLGNNPSEALATYIDPHVFDQARISA